MEELPEYDYVVSSRLGRTSSKEQYAFIYREGIQLIDSYVVEDVNDTFEREPFVGVFEVNNYSINLMQIHTKPDDAEKEIDGLLDLRLAQRQIWLGDFNADCSYYDESQGELYNWVIPDSEDTTVKATDCTYDRIVVTDEVLPLVKGYDINRLEEYNYSFQVLMSDHYPVEVVLDVSVTINASNIIAELDYCEKSSDCYCCDGIPGTGYQHICVSRDYLKRRYGDVGCALEGHEASFCHTHICRCRNLVCDAKENGSFEQYFDWDGCQSHVYAINCGYLNGKCYCSEFNDWGCNTDEECKERYNGYGGVICAEYKVCMPRELYYGRYLR